jgi:hypothetical protein
MITSSGAQVVYGVGAVASWGTYLWNDFVSTSLQDFAATCLSSTSSSGCERLSATVSIIGAVKITANCVASAAAGGLALVNAYELTKCSDKSHEPKSFYDRLFGSPARKAATCGVTVTLLATSVLAGINIWLELEMGKSCGTPRSYSSSQCDWLKRWAIGQPAGAIAALYLQLALWAALGASRVYQRTVTNKGEQTLLLSQRGDLA